MTLNSQPISDQTWQGIRTEFTLHTLEQVRHRLSVVELFEHATELKIPHNYFTVWMVPPSRELSRSRPVIARVVQ